MQKKNNRDFEFSAQIGKVATPWSEQALEWGLLFCGGLSIFTTIGFVGVLIFETIAFFKEVSFSQFFLDTRWTPLFVDKHFGIWPLIIGTATTSIIAIVVALPFGLLAAIYLSEFASEKVRRTVKPSLEVLAGIPTVVYGYFALTVLTPILQKIVPGLSGFNTLSPGIVMGVMIIPMISSLSEDAIFSVPFGLREAAYGLGASKLPTIFRVVLPAASSGILASLSLAIARAIGETMIVTIAAGQEPRFSFDPRNPMATMTAYIVQVSLGDTPFGSLEYKTIFVVGSTLFVSTLIFNMASVLMVKRNNQ